MIKLIQQIYGIYPNPHTGFLLVNQKRTCFFIFHLQIKALGSYAPSIFGDIPQ